MKKKIPFKTLFIAPYKMLVKYEPRLGEIASVTGSCGEDKQIILIDPDLGPDTEKDTFLHEALHMIWGQTALNRTYTDDQEEEVIYTLTPRILALIRDNKEFFIWLSKI